MRVEAENIAKVFSACAEVVHWGYGATAELLGILRVRGGSSGYPSQRTGVSGYSPRARR